MTNNSYSFICDTADREKSKKVGYWPFQIAKCNWNKIIIFFIIFACITLIVSVSMYVGQTGTQWSVNDSITGISCGAVGFLLFCIGYYYTNKPSKYAKYDIESTDIEKLQGIKETLKSAKMKHSELKSELSDINSAILTKKGMKETSKTLHAAYDLTSTGLSKAAKSTSSGISNVRKKLGKGDGEDEKENDELRPLNLNNTPSVETTQKRSIKEKLTPFKKSKMRLSLDELDKEKNTLTEQIKKLEEEIKIYEMEFLLLTNINNKYHIILQQGSNFKNDMFDFVKNINIEKASELNSKYSEESMINKYIKDVLKSDKLNKYEEDRIKDIKYLYKSIYNNVISIMPDYLKFKNVVYTKDIEYEKIIDNAYNASKMLEYKNNIDDKRKEKELVINLLKFSDDIETTNAYYENIIINKINEYINFISNAEKEQLNNLKNKLNAEKDSVTISNNKNVINLYNKFYDKLNERIHTFLAAEEKIKAEENAAAEKARSIQKANKIAEEEARKITAKKQKEAEEEAAEVREKERWGKLSLVEKGIELFKKAPEKLIPSNELELV